jgi:hypothetical protein
MAARFRERSDTAPRNSSATQQRAVTGNPDEKHISTSYVEPNNLTMRMHMRRFTRLTNAFSKKVENHAHAVALIAMYYNLSSCTKPIGSRQRWPQASRIGCGR